MNVVTKEEHVTKVEHWHRLIKDRGRLHYAMLLLKYLPRMMVVHLMNAIVFYVNAFVRKRGTYHVTPPLTIVEGIGFGY